jgi:hypothetical protein
MLVWVGSAAAQAGDDPPGTLTLDRMDSASRLGIQVGFDTIDDADGSIMRFNPYGQFLFPNRLVGVYGQLPISHLFYSEGADTTAMGNFDAGAFFLPLRDSSLILRVGLALPTASDSFRDYAVNAISSLERISDFALVLPECTYLRLSGSTVQQSGMAFLRLDLGLDLAIDKPRGADASFLRANLAGGLRLGTVDMSLELASTGNLDSRGSASERFLHTLALAFRTQGPDQFYGGMVLPLDEDLRGEIWIFSVGYQHRID